MAGRASCDASERGTLLPGKAVNVAGALLGGFSFLVRRSESSFP